jgi:23S rRNA (guanosine2251-2'-O)-methyltransferase
MQYKKHPRDRFLSVYGRKPVLEVLDDSNLKIHKVLLAKKAKGDIIKQILAACEDRGVDVQRVTPEQVSHISKHPKQDQGIVADVETPFMDDALNFIKNAKDKCTRLVALDGITTPGNVGMIIRTCTALGIDGIILPRKGCAKLDALVVKASAGVVFKSAVLKCERLTPVLKQAQSEGYKVYALSGEQGKNIYQESFAEKCIFVLGNETNGVSESTEEQVHQHFTIPMAAGVESLNVACAATVVASEIMRRNF